MKPQPTKNQQILLGLRPSGEATLDNFLSPRGCFRILTEDQELSS
jgi:hypothetical protein